MADGPNSAGWGELAALTLPQIGAMYLQEVVKECPLGYLTAVLIKAKPGDLWLVHVGAQPPKCIVTDSPCDTGTGPLFSYLHQAFTCATSESSCFHILADQAGRECCTAQLGFSLYFNESVIQSKKPLRLSKHFETFWWQKNETG